MRSSDVDILIVADPDGGHWASRWAGRLPTARRVAAARGESLADALAAAAQAATRPVVVVAYDVGVLAVAEAGPRLVGHVAGAFLVAAPLSGAAAEAERLPFPSLLGASRDDPLAPYAASEALARALGAELVDAGASGRLDRSSGHGPWPEGLMRFAGFLKHLGAAPPAAP